MKAAVAAVALVVLCLTALASDEATISPQPKALIVPTPNSIMASSDAITIPALLSYQGKLTDASGVPVPDSTHTVTFRLYKVSSGGASFYTETQAITPRLGLFSTLIGNMQQLDSVPQSGLLYLGMQIGSSSEMTPRTRVASAAYSFLAGNAAKLSGMTLDSLDARYGSGSDFGRQGVSNTLYEGSSTLASKYVDVAGDSITGTLAVGGQLRVVGTVTARSQLIVADKAAIGYQCANSGASAFVAGYQDTATGDYSTVGGGQRNKAGGGPHATVSGGHNNLASASLSAVGGGGSDTASGMYAVVSGGHHNLASGDYSTIGGGWDNKAFVQSTVAGGYRNWANGSAAAIGGGVLNIANGDSATVGGGAANAVYDDFASIAGGKQNTINGGRAASIGGGEMNHVSGNYCVVPGGYGDSVAGFANLAAGYMVRIGSGASSTMAFGQNFSTTANYAVVFCHGDGRSTKLGIGVPNPTRTIDVYGGAYCDGANWVNSSSRALKTDIVSLTPGELQTVLDDLGRTEVVRYRYKAQDTGERHIGLIAEDAPEAIATPARDGINTSDAIGWLVAIAKAQQARIDALEAELATQRK